MRARFLLDTNIKSDAVRQPHGPIGTRMARLEGQICTSIIVAGELRYGAAKRGGLRTGRRIAEVLETLDVLAFQSPADATYAILRTDLERRGETIGSNDMLIAAQALALELVLVTDNVREFSRVAGLQIENWLR